MTQCSTYDHHPDFFQGRAPLVEIYKGSSSLVSRHLITKVSVEANYLPSIRSSSRLRGLLRAKRPPRPSLEMSTGSARERHRLITTDPLAPPARHRTGCWTCRIRKKRCDETPNGVGVCGECDRLAIKCLGWGERRPDWCRVRHNFLLLLLDPPMIE